MAANSKIEWTDSTWTPVRARLPLWEKTSPGGNEYGQGKVGWHCEHVSEGCRNCYAETMNKRLGTGLDFKPGNRSEIELFLDEKILLAPLSWRKPRMIFVCSMTDLFADFVPNEWIDRMFVVMALCPQHVFQILTKRPERMREYLSQPRIEERWIRADTYKIQANTAVRWRSPLPNVWLGTSCEDQATAAARTNFLRETPAAIRFLSLEPLLGPIVPNLTGISWVICGGESGHGARPLHPHWARSLRDQCAVAGVPFFFKQWGAFRLGEYHESQDSCIHWFDGEKEFYSDHQDIKYGDHWLSNDGVKLTIAYPTSKKRAGRLLDGVEHNGMPTND